MTITDDRLNGGDASGESPMLTHEPLESFCLSLIYLLCDLNVQYPAFYDDSMVYLQCGIPL